MEGRAGTLLCSVGAALTLVLLPGMVSAQSSRVRLLDDTYTLEKVFSTAFGLPSQIALLSDGRMVVTDSNNSRVVVVSSQTVTTLVSGPDLNAWPVAALPDDRICYATRSGQIMLIDPATGVSTFFATVPSNWVSALAADGQSSIYAASGGRDLFRFTSQGLRSTIARALPFANITDLDVSADGTVYVAGYNRVVAVPPGGTVTTIADGLNYEPVYVEVSPSGQVFIDDVSKGLQRYDPSTGQVTDSNVAGFHPFLDILAPTADELIFHEFGVYYRHDFTTGATRPLFVVFGNSFAFAAGRSNSVFLATPSNPPALSSHIVEITSQGTVRHFDELSAGRIMSIDVDRQGRLCAATNQGFWRVEANNSVTPIAPSFPGGSPGPLRRIAVGPTGDWYGITSDFYDSIRVWRFEESGNAQYLPISFNRDSFGGAYKVWDASIDSSDRGKLGLIVTAIGSEGQGPYYQRVFLADADGGNLTLLANLDCQRIGGMVDIAFGPGDDLFVLALTGGTGGPEKIFRIDDHGGLSVVIELQAGNDPQSLDVDFRGDLWFCTTDGVYLAAHPLSARSWQVYP